jgi:acyl carrier protein
MTREDFIREFADILGVDDGSLAPETVLASLDAWDSVAYLSTVVLIDDQLGMALRPDQLESAVTVNDLLAMIASRLSA